MLLRKLFRENLHYMACKQPIATYVAKPTSSYTNKLVLDSMDASPPGPRFGTLGYQFRFFPLTFSQFQRVVDKVLVWSFKWLGFDSRCTDQRGQIFARPQAGTSLANMQLISLNEVNKPEMFLMIVVKQNSIVFGSTRTLNAVDSHS